MEDLDESYREILRNGMITTGPYADSLGKVIANQLGVNHAIAVSSCTTGLMLAVQAMALPPDSEVVLPSFTFMASGLGPVWNRLRLRFADVDRETMNVTAQSVEQALTSNTSAILAAHQFGNPTPVDELQSLAQRHGLTLLFDAAHGFGSLHKKQPLGRFGNAEIFSMSPTKLLIAAEGGIVATNDDRIADHVRIGRNYGNPGNYDCLFAGINARMSELHALLALQSFQSLEAAAQHRNRVATYFCERFASLPGIRCQKIDPCNRSSYKDFSIVVEEREFGLDRMRLADALSAEGIQTRVYYSPVLHRMKAYQEFVDKDAQERLANTLYLESNALSLPLYSDMSAEEAETICEAIECIHHHARELSAG
jgi:dTDP-4-amino-4,6-dideoxygalactose transaminase